MQENELSLWTIVYVKTLDRKKGTPPGAAFEILNRSDQGDSYVHDVVERDPLAPTIGHP